MIRRALAAAVCLLLVPATVRTQLRSPIRGFTAASSDVQRQVEEKFRAVPKPENNREYMRVISAEPHHAGSPGSQKVADYMLAQFKSWGLNASIETFEALMPYPTERVLELVAPVSAGAEARGAGGRRRIPTRPTRARCRRSTLTPPTATSPRELVYVNYGTPEDYEQLAKLGVDVKGKIVIARYGRSWRGIKPKVASEHGAVGCIIYSDPREDGYFQGDVFPQGAYRPEMGAQRGSVMDMPIHPGDPLTPGYGVRTGRAAARARGVEDTPQDSGPADLLRRGAAAAAQSQGTGRARIVARRAADHVSRRRRTGEGPSQAGVRVGQSSALQRHRPHRRIRVPRRVDHPRQPSRRVGQRRVGSDQRQRRPDGDRSRARRAAEGRLAAEAHHHPRVMGRRGMGTARVDGMGREARRRTLDEGRRLHQQRQHVEGLARRRRLALAPGLRQRPDAGSPGSEARQEEPLRRQGAIAV